MFKISGFADEISPDPDVEIETAAALGMRYVSIRSVWDKNVVELEDEELARVHGKLIAGGIKVSSIGSPIGKISIKEPFDEHLEWFNRAVNAAQILEAPYIRVFSFYMDKEEKPKYESEVLRRLEIMVSVAEKNGLVLLHENEGGIFGETSEECLRLFKALPSKYFRAAFDPCNFVTAGENVMEDSFPQMRDYISYLHIKDVRRSDGQTTLPGEGDGDIPEVLKALRDGGDIFLTLEPHLVVSGELRGFSGPEMFGKAHAKLLEIINNL